MDWIEILKLGVSAAALLMTFVLFTTTSRRKETDHLHSRVSTLRDDVGDLEGRLGKVETEIEHLPDKEMFNLLSVSVERVSGQIGRMDGKLDGMNDAFEARLMGVFNNVERIERSVEQLVTNELDEARDAKNHARKTPGSSK